MESCEYHDCEMAREVITSTKCFFFFLQLDRPSIIEVGRDGCLEVQGQLIETFNKIIKLVTSTCTVLNLKKKKQRIEKNRIN